MTATLETKHTTGYTNETTEYGNNLTWSNDPDTFDSARGSWTDPQVPQASNETKHTTAPTNETKH